MSVATRHYTRRPDNGDTPHARKHLNSDVCYRGFRHVEHLQERAAFREQLYAGVVDGATREVGRLFKAKAKPLLRALVTDPSDDGTAPQQLIFRFGHLDTRDEVFAVLNQARALGTSSSALGKIGGFVAIKTPDAERCGKKGKVETALDSNLDSEKQKKKPGSLEAPIQSKNPSKPAVGQHSQSRAKTALIGALTEYKNSSGTTSFAANLQIQLFSKRHSTIVLRAEAIEQALLSMGNPSSFSGSVRKLVFNLRSNKELARRVIEGEVSAAELVVMDASALASEAVARKKAGLKRKARLNAMTPEVSAVDMKASFPCRSCLQQDTCVVRVRENGNVLAWKQRNKMLYIARCLACGAVWNRDAL